MQLWRKEPPKIITQKEYSELHEYRPPSKRRENDPAIKVGGMFQTQRAFYEDQSLYKFFIGGYGSGKSEIICKVMAALSIYNTPYPCLLVSPTYKMAERTTIPTLKTLLTNRRIKFNYNSTKHFFQIFYQGFVGNLWIGSGDDPDSLKGSNLAAAGQDEPFLQKLAVLEQLTARVREPRARHSCIAGAGTPEGIGGYGYELIEGDESDVESLRSRYMGNGSMAVYRAKTSENLALPQHYLDNLRRTYDKKMLEAYFDGQFVQISTNLVYYNFTDDNIKDIPDPGGPLCVGLDFNVNPMAGVVFWKQGNHMHYMDELEIPNSNTEKWIKKIHDRYPLTPASKTKSRIKEAYPDPTGKRRQPSAPVGRTDFTLIENRGQHFGEYPSCRVLAREWQSQRDRLNATNKKLENLTLTVSPKCKKLILYFKSLSSDKLNEATQREAQKAMGHLLDGATYPVAYIYPLKKPIIQGQYHV